MRFNGRAKITWLIMLSLCGATASCADEDSPPQEIASEGAPCSLEGATYQQLICQEARWIKNTPTPDMNVCDAESNTSFCARQSSSCGLTTGKDNCGAIRTISCGDCAQGMCQDNACSCVAEDDTALCARLSKNCGMVTAEDSCGAMRAVKSCGDCAEPALCQDNTCVCIPETDPAFCDRLSKNCGMVTDMDRCGVMRTINCGGCTAPATCQTDHTCA